MANRGTDGGGRADVTVRPCSFLSLCSVLVVLTCDFGEVGSRNRCCRALHICTFSVAEPGSGIFDAMMDSAAFQVLVAEAVAHAS